MKRKWTPLQKAEYDPAGVHALLQTGMVPGTYQVWQNEIYEVCHHFHAGTIEFPNGGGIPVAHLSIKDRTKKPVRSWRDLQRIKNQICGEESEAVELFPAKSRLVDMANQYHLWVVPHPHRFPVGWFNVAEGAKAAGVPRPTNYDADTPDGRRADGSRQQPEGAS